MQAVTTIGLDIAKSVFQIHGVDAAGNVIVRRQLKRRYVLPFFQKLPPCLVGIEACASSHHWYGPLVGAKITTEQSVNASADAKEIDDKLKATAQTPSRGGAQEFAASIEQQRAQIATIVKALGIQPTR
jgi:transposase